MLGRGCELLLLALALTACDLISGPPTPTQLGIVVPGDGKLRMGQPGIVQAKVTNDGGDPVAGVTVTWRSYLVFERCCSFGPISYGPTVIDSEVSVTDAAGTAATSFTTWHLTGNTVVAVAGTLRDSVTIVIDDTNNLFAWTPIIAPSVPWPVSGAAYNGRIYLAGCNPTSTLPVYDPASDTWSSVSAPALYTDCGQATNNPFQYGPPRLAALDDGIHWLGFSDHYVYDEATRAWSRRGVSRASAAQARGGAPSPTGLSFSNWNTVEGLNGRLYQLSSEGSTWIYDTRTDSWSQGASLSLPTPATPGTTTVLDGAIYVAVDGYGSTQPLYRYDVNANQWTKLTTQPIPRWLFASGAITGRFCVFGGGIVFSRDSHALPETHCYDPGSDRWTAGPTVPASFTVGVTAVELGGHVYAFGGGYYDIGHRWQRTSWAARLSPR